MISSLALLSFKMIMPPYGDIRYKAGSAVFSDIAQTSTKSNKPEHSWIDYSIDLSVF